MAFHYKPKQSMTWRIGWYDDITGKLLSESAKTKDEAVAKRKAKDKSAKLLLKIQESKLVTPGDHRYKISQAFTMFLEHKDYPDTTKKAYSQALAHLINATGDKYLYKFTKQDMAALNKEFKQPKIYKKKDPESGELIDASVKYPAQNSIANYTRHLHTFFNWMVKNSLIKENIIEKRKQEKKDVEVIPLDHLKVLFEDIKNNSKTDKYYNILKLKYLAAYRANEVLSSRAEDFDFKNNIVHIRNSKGKRTDKIPMVSDLRDHLLTMKLPKEGKIVNLTYAGLRSALVRSNARTGYDYNLHQFRKTRGTELANMGVNPYFLQKFMRHENFVTTQQYYIKIDVQKAERDINERIDLYLGGGAESLNITLLKELSVIINISELAKRAGIDEETLKQKIHAGIDINEKERTNIVRVLTEICHKIKAALKL